VDTREIGGGNLTLFSTALPIQLPLYQLNYHLGGAADLIEHLLGIMVKKVRATRL
jgi:hypothetical protein